MFLVLPLLFCTLLSATPLSDAALAMKAGSFRPVTTTGLTQETFYSDYIGVSGAKCNEPIFAFTQNGHWDSEGEEILYMGSPHRGAWKFPIYSAKTNSWRLNPLPPSVAPLDFCTHHSYDKMALDTKRRQYYGEWGCWNGDTGTWLYRYDIASATWSKVNDKNRGATGMGGHPAMEFFPEMDGIVMVGEAGGIISILNPETDTWRVLPGRSRGDMHHILEYNPVFKIMLLGGGVGNQQLFILDTTGKTRALKTPPVHVSVADGGGVMSCDPVSGMYLYFMDKTIWEFDPIHDTWKSVCNYPNNISMTGRSSVVNFYEYGVLGILSCTSWPLLLYKHTQPTAVENSAFRPNEPELSCAPNPFNPATRITLRLTTSAYVRLAVYGSDGRLLSKLTAQNLGSGSHTFEWEASDSRGRRVPAGLYTVVLNAGAQSLARKVILSK